MIQEVVHTKQTDVQKAVDELTGHLAKNGSSYNLILFFAGTDIDFAVLSAALYEAFPNAQVVGTTTSGEISGDGFSSGTVVLNAISDERSSYSAVLVDEANRFPIVFKDKIIAAARKTGINLSQSQIHRDSFAISLICGLKNIEEGFLSMLYSFIEDKEFLVCGGTSGDDLKFNATYVSYNGEISDCGAVIIFVKTNRKFEIYKENIFQKSGKSVRLTDVDHETHIVKSIDGKNPRRRYAEILEIDERGVNDALLSYPFGRTFGDNVFIASLVGFDEAGILTTYARVIQDSVQEILEPMDAVKVTEESCNAIREKIPNPSCVILFNCILRTIMFDKQHLQESINNIWKSYYPVYSGFSTYGEQFGHINSNQTLVTLVMGE